jgi:hypothetical protein
MKWIVMMVLANGHLHLINSTEKPIKKTHSFCCPNSEALEDKGKPRVFCLLGYTPRGSGQLPHFLNTYAFACIIINNDSNNF